VADIKSEYLAGFELECMADFIGIRNVTRQHSNFPAFAQELVTS
jgi:hypothetical protein